MNRFHAGFIQYHSLLRDLEFYWRVEPESKYLCDIDFDPFLFMKENNKKFGKLTAITSFSALSQRLISLISKILKNSVRYQWWWENGKYSNSLGSYTQLHHVTLVIRCFLGRRHTAFDYQQRMAVFQWLSFLEQLCNIFSGLSAVS